jgi:hypothetical protein
MPYLFQYHLFTFIGIGRSFGISASDCASDAFANRRHCYNVNAPRTTIVQTDLAHANNNNENNNNSNTFATPPRGKRLRKLADELSSPVPP